jgi:hypothetical protein
MSYPSQNNKNSKFFCEYILALIFISPPPTQPSMTKKQKKIKPKKKKNLQEKKLLMNKNEK